MLVLLLSFEGIAPGDAIQMRLFGTLLGSALALAAYLAWPTWEGRRANIALAKLIESYRAHIRAVLGNDIAALYETRTSARAARTGVLASLERLQAEPKRAQARKELALTESFLANAHRLIRTSLSLEAVLRDEGSLPELPELADFRRRWIAPWRRSPRTYATTRRCRRIPRAPPSAVLPRHSKRIRCWPIRLRGSPWPTPATASPTASTRWRTCCAGMGRALRRQPWQRPGKLPAC